MAAHIDMAGGDLPGGRRIVMVGQAQRAAVVVQQIENIIIIPTRLAKLEGVAVGRRQQRQESRQSLAVGGKMRGELE